VLYGWLPPPDSRSILPPSPALGSVSCPPYPSAFFPVRVLLLGGCSGAGMPPRGFRFGCLDWTGPVPFLLGTWAPGGVSGRPVSPGFVLGSRLDVPSPGHLRRVCPLFLSSPHSGSPPGFVRRLRLAPDAAACGVEMPWVPCSRPDVVLLASCPWSDLDSRPEEPWASGIPPRLQFRVRGAHLPRGRLWPVPVRRASGKPDCLHRCVRSL
jgi:hypothetical protein